MKSKGTLLSQCPVKKKKKRKERKKQTPQPGFEPLSLVQMSNALSNEPYQNTSFYYFNVDMR